MITAKNLQYELKMAHLLCFSEEWRLKIEFNQDDGNLQSKKTFSIATGSISCNDGNLFNEIQAKGIIIGLVDTETFKGFYNLNPFNFKHWDLKYCGLLIAGKMIRWGETASP